MIYTRWGNEITAVTGKVAEIDGAKYGMNGEVELMFDQNNRPHFFHTLKADGGIDEIEAAFMSAPHRVLSDADLEAAVKRAL